MLRMKLYDLRKAHMSKFKETKRRGLKAIFSKAQPDRLCLLVASLFQQTIQCFDFPLGCCLYYSNIYS